MPSFETFSAWFDRGVEKGATHMIVVCDTFDYSDAPVYVMPGEDVHKRQAEEGGKPMQKVMEVYCMSKPKDPQIRAQRSWTY
jgi:hypothetical protein